MANANAFLDQLVGLGLRHGEKAGIALASMIFFVCVGTAATQKGIETSPDQVKKAADQSDANLNRREERETILKTLEERDKITKTNFAESVEEQIKVALVPDNYKPAREWVTPEPGAGLIRDTPKLVAVNELYAYPGRGGLLVFALDESGERIPLKEGEDVEEKKQRLGNTRRPKAGGGGMGGGMGGQRKRKGKARVEIEREAEEERQLEIKRNAAKLSGGTVADAKNTTKTETESDDDKGPFKEVTKGYRWVALTGTLDHGQMLAYYREALKNPAVAHPHYARLDLQRKVFQPDGTWTDWQDVDAKKNYEVLDNLPEKEDELAPENVLPKNLVDTLPFLKAGLWEKVHIASLVPKEKVEVPELQKTRGAMGAMGGRGAMGAMGGRGAMGGMGGMGAMMAGVANQQSTMMANMMRGPGGRMGGAMGGMMSMAGGASESVGNFWKSEEKKVMIRALDFTAETDATYRYRVRIVVFNPNYNHEDVSPEARADVKKKVLLGPWSKETDPVTMPPDVMPYAVDTLPKNPRGDTKVRFDVVRFHPSDGVTVPHHFDATVGELVGERRRTDVPVSDGSGKKSVPIDFTTHQLVLDIAGGDIQLLPSGFVGTPIERPAMAALLRTDGSIAVHSQAEDFANEIRKDIDSTYNKEIEESGKKRKNSQGAGAMGMMQGMMGGMGGGMMGGMGGGGRR